MTGWARGGSRRSPLPPDWPWRRRSVLLRDKVCRCLGCRHHQGRCDRPSSEAHHLDPENHSLERLIGLCHDCHMQHTLRERWGESFPDRRPQEQHPALGGGML